MQGKTPAVFHLQNPTQLPQSHYSLPTCQKTQLIRMVRRVGVVGYGALGRYLANQVEGRDDLELVWVWNRTPVADLPQHLLLNDLNQCDKGAPDLIVEVAHPDVTKEYGARFLEVKIYTLSFLQMFFKGCRLHDRVPCRSGRANS